jgi:hypothetical protein
MTRIRSFRFRRLVVVLAIGAGTLGLAAGTAAASTTGNPTPAPAKHHHKVVRHCEFVELTGSAADNDRNGQDVGSTPRALAPDQQGSTSDERKGERVEVFQLAKVCETGEHLTVIDVTKPYVEETEQGRADHHDAYPTPSATAPSAYTG